MYIVQTVGMCSLAFFIYLSDFSFSYVLAAAVTLSIQQSQDALGQRKSTEKERRWRDRKRGGGRTIGSKSQMKDVDSHCEKGFLCLDG